MARPKVVIIGSGFSGLSAACFMAKAGWEVVVLEKHNMPGGRARKLEEKGFIFDMGPSWYWMPDVFERFFNQFDKKASDYYSLSRLDPSYRVYWDDGITDIPADYTQLRQLFDEFETGAGDRLDAFLQQAEYKYNVGMRKLVYKPGRSVTEFFDREVVSGLLKLDLFNSMKAHVARFFKHPKLRELMEFPVLFLGALPENTPALYSLMNYADVKGGTWFPKCGMYSVAEGMYRLAKELGVRFLFGENATRIQVEDGYAVRVLTERNRFDADAVIASADYHFVDTKLLEKKYSSYSTGYWNKRVMAPGCLLYYVGIDKKLEGVQHHSLFFDTPFEPHAKDIYVNNRWPEDPLFYVSITSLTDPSLAPEGCENLFFLIPIAPGLTDDDESKREHYFSKIVKRFEQHIGQKITGNIVYKRSYSYTDFVTDYNSFKGNAYGLANTLSQTAVLKPSIKSKKVRNLYFTGQLTVPGPGVPPCLISGEVVSRQVVKDAERSKMKTF